MKRLLTILLLLAAAGTAPLMVPSLAAGAARPTGGEPGADRFAQPVRVGDLIGQKLIGPDESQPLLGHVEAVERRADGSVVIRVKTWSLLPWGGKTVHVPLEAVSFLGPQLALTGLTEAQLAALPEARSDAPVSADETIRVGLVKPFH